MLEVKRRFFHLHLLNEPSEPFIRQLVRYAGHEDAVVIVFLSSLAKPSHIAVSALARIAALIGCLLIRCSAIDRSITPPFEVSRPPSKAAVNSLGLNGWKREWQTGIIGHGGVAFADEGDGAGFATESYAASALYTTLASLSGALSRIRRASGNSDWTARPSSAAC